MKLRLTPILAFYLLCTSYLNAQTTESINIELHNVPMAEALKNIENKSGSHILFYYKDIEQFKVSCDLKDMSFDKVMEFILSGKPLTYKKVHDNTYII